MTMTLAARLVAAPKLPAYTDALAPALIGLADANDPLILLAAVATASRLALEHFTAHEVAELMRAIANEYDGGGRPN